MRCVSHSLGIAPSRRCFACARHAASSSRSDLVRRRAGDRIRLVFKRPAKGKETKGLKKAVEKKVLYEDEDMAVCVKPPAVISHRFRHAPTRLSSMRMHPALRKR